ncbi:MAG: FIST C-terminal domain-containing protein [Burkholderiales bacterium]|nr:FIST C-terminal domain-containing protein [Burkholderiales bacterium]
MPALRCGHAGAATWRQAARLALARLLPVPGGANLGFLYLSDDFAADAAQLLEFFRRETGVSDWVGTVGLGVIGEDVEYMNMPSVSVMVGAFPEDGFRVFSGRSRPPPLDEHTANGRPVAHCALVHADPGTPDLADLVSDMAGKLASGFAVGGVSSSRGEALQIANEVLRGGLSGVVLSGDIDLRAGVTQGCTPLRSADRSRRTHRITACRGNVIESLDGRPALEVFVDDLGDAFDGDLVRAASGFLAGLPLDEDESADFLARNIVGLDSRAGLLAVAAQIEEGAPIMFCRRDAMAAREDLARMTRRLAERLGRAPQGGLYVSCIARGANLFGTPSEEAKIIRRELGSFPMVGFFANGEIAHARLYAYTGVLVLFA